MKSETKGEIFRRGFIKTAAVASLPGAIKLPGNIAKLPKVRNAVGIGATQQFDPVTAGGQAAVAVAVTEVVGGLKRTITATDEATVIAAARAECPHGNRKAFQSEKDTEDTIFEFFLDVDTGRQSTPHSIASAEMHYHYSPPPRELERTQGADWGWTDNLNMYKEPERFIATTAEDIDGEAVAVSAGCFAENGINFGPMKLDKFGDDPDEDHQSLNLLSLDSGSTVPDIRLANGDDLKTLSVVTVKLSPEMFTFTREEDTVQIEPKLSKIDAFHDYAQTGGGDIILIPPSEDGDVLGQTLSDLWNQAATESTVWKLGADTDRAEFTVTGASIEFREATLITDEPDIEVVLQTYLEDPAYTRVVAPPGAQPGYTPRVEFQTAVISTEAASPPSNAAGHLLSGPAHGNDNLRPVRLHVGIQGSLFDAVIRAAKNQTSPTAATFRQLETGDSIDLSFALTRLHNGGAYSHTQARLTHLQVGQLVGLFNENIDRVPGLIRGAFATERIQSYIRPLGDDSELEFWNFETFEGPVVKYDNSETPRPTIKVYTDRETVYSILRAEKPGLAAKDAIDAGKISYHGVGPFNWVKVGFAKAAYSLYNATGGVWG